MLRRCKNTLSGAGEMCPSHAYDVLLDIILANVNNGFI